MNGKADASHPPVKCPQAGVPTSQQENDRFCGTVLGKNVMSFWSNVFGSSRKIHEAAQKGNLELVRELLKDNPDLVFSKDDNGRAPLHSAAANGYVDVVKALLVAKADVNARKNDGETPLHTAYSNADVTKLLLANGADVNARRNDGKTPLHLATL